LRDIFWRKNPEKIQTNQEGRVLKRQDFSRRGLQIKGPLFGTYRHLTIEDTSAVRSAFYMFASSEHQRVKTNESKILANRD